MAEPRNICPLCYAPFTKGSVEIDNSDDIQKHYWWHLLETGQPPKLVKTKKEKT